MHIVFGWGEAPKEQPYRVSSVSYDLYHHGGDEQLGNCSAGSLTLQLDLGVPKDPAAEILKFARGQIEACKKNGAGMVSIYQNEEAQSSFQDIVFSQAWVTSFSQTTQKPDRSVTVIVTFAAGRLKVSNVEFQNTTRLDAVGR